MQTYILTLQENITDVHFLVDLPVTVDNMTVASIAHIHACIILLLIFIHSMQHVMLIGKKFPATVATAKCDHNNCFICHTNYRQTASE